MTPLSAHGATIGLVLAVLLLAICWYEIKDAIIPDAVTIPGVGIGMVLHLSLSTGRLGDAAIGVVVGYSLPAIVARLYRHLRGTEGLGMGVAKMGALVGAFLGWFGVVLSFLVSFMLGTAYGLAMMAKGRQQSTLEFGPVLAGATLVVVGASVVGLIRQLL